MTLWIRTQDRTNLTKVERIYVNIDNEVLNYTITGECICLGHYETKERALEVLDEIQKKITEASVIWIENKRIASSLPMKDRETRLLQDYVKAGMPILDERFQLKSVNIDTIVYEMPEE